MAANSFKNPITVMKLKAIKAQMYIKALTMILKTKLEEGQTEPFQLITNHVYDGFDQSKSEKIPCLLIGIPKDGANAWKKFRETTIGNNEKQKDYTLVGQCTRVGNTLVLTIDKSKGMNKLPKSVEKRLNALLNKIVKGMTVTTRGGVEDGEEETPETTTAPVGTVSQKDQPKEETTQTEQKTAKKAPKNKEEAIEQFKEEKIEEAKDLSQYITQFRALFDGKLQVVVNNVKKGQTTKKDAKVVKETNQVYDKAVKAYRKTAKQVQEKFKKAYDELQSGKKTLYELAIATKHTRKSMAQIVADNYFQATENRPATDKEVNQIQSFIKDALDINRKGGYKAPEATVIHAVSYVIKQVGGLDRYKNEFVEQILSKRQAA